MNGSAEQVAELLWTTWRDKRRLEALPGPIRPRTPEDGWAAQQQLSTLIGPFYGWKIAATSAAGQAHIGVPGPLPGRLFERFRYEPGATLPSDDLHMGVVEAEFAFRMGRDVPAAASASELVDAVSDLHLAVEIPDSRFTRPETVGGPSLIADAACAGAFVLGPSVSGWRDSDLSACRTQVEINGEIAAEGSGSAVLGSPHTALAWLAAELVRLGRGLRAGEIVSTGTTTTPPTIAAGDDVRATFDGFGEVRLAFAR